MRISAVLFDLGDTLIFQAHTPDPLVVYPAMARQVRPLVDRWGASLPLDLPTLLNDIYRAVETAQPARRARGLEVDGAFIARGALASNGIDVSAEQARKLWRATAIDYPTWGAQLYPDTIDTLSRLHALAMPVACVSNNWNDSIAMRRQLRSLGVPDELLPVLVSSTDMMRVKPRPEPFERALEITGVDAASVIFVGDELEADMRGAKALGMTTVWKLNGRHEVTPDPDVDYMVHDLWEIFTLGLLPEGPTAVVDPESLTPHEDANADRY
jgi:HAD superfamily hydrolase (TIGR01509 family)